MIPIYVVRKDGVDREVFWPLIVTLNKEAAEACLEENKNADEHAEYWIDIYDGETGRMIDQ